MISVLLYSLLVRLYATGIRAIAPFHTKAALWINGRKNVFRQLENSKTERSGRKVIWFHCASLGEFEQGRPILEHLRSSDPDCYIVLSFFSPSGYEVRKKYSQANLILYLPTDTSRNARKWIDLLKPSMAFFVKYEFWYFYLKALEEASVPHYLISGIFRPNQFLFKPGAAFLKNRLKGFDCLFVQNQASCIVLQQEGIQNFILSGDTRLDRVCEIAAQPYELTQLLHPSTDKPLLVAGSTWASDLPLLASVAEKCNILVAPHNVTESECQLIETTFAARKVRRLSNIQPGEDLPNICIVDSVGVLSFLYRFADIAYVGGGFGKAIHNTMEPAVYGKPVIFGPAFRKFAEAEGLKDAGGGIPVFSASEFTEVLFKLIDNKDYRVDVGRKAAAYVQQNAGATKRIIETIRQQSANR